MRGSQDFVASDTNGPKVAVPRAKVSPAAWDWFNEEGLGNTGHIRRTELKHLRYIISHRLRAGVASPRDTMTHKEAKTILLQHRNARNANRDSARKWADRIIARLVKNPFIDSKPPAFTITFFNDVFGQDEDIDSLHRQRHGLI